MKAVTHKCKFDNRPEHADLPWCPHQNRLCHSPCDLVSGLGFTVPSIDTPNGHVEGDQFVDDGASWMATDGH